MQYAKFNDLVFLWHIVKMLSLNGEEINEPNDPIKFDFQEQPPEGDASEGKDTNFNAGTQYHGLESSAQLSNNMGEENFGKSQPITLSPIVNINLNKKSSINSIPSIKSDKYEGNEQSSFMNSSVRSDRPIWVVYEDKAIETDASKEISVNVEKEKHENNIEIVETVENREEEERNVENEEERNEENEENEEERNEENEENEEKRE